MSMLTLGMSEEFKRYGISVNALWPRKIIATAAVEFELGGGDLMRSGRTPAIMADAAHIVLTSRARSISGQLLLDEDVLRSAGQVDFGRYQDGRDNSELRTDLFVDD